MNANIFSRKIEMTKAEAKAAGKIDSEKYNELRRYMKEFPGFEIHIKAAPKRKVEFRDLNYDYMRAYIKKHDDDDGKIMDQYKDLRGLSVQAKEALAEPCSYLEVRAWFLKTYPAIAKFHENREKLLAA